MSAEISGTKITLTRGDTLQTTVSLLKKDGSLYTPVEGDTIVFRMKRHYSDSQPLIEKILDNEDLTLEILPEDTKKLPFGDYVYDIEIVKADGYVDTFIKKAVLHLDEEV